MEIKKTHVGEDYVKIEVNGVERELPLVVGNNLMRAITALVKIIEAYQ